MERIVRKKIAIIGAGPAGLTAAHELALKGYQVHLFEASKSVGGMAKSIRLWNQIIDLGPHRFFSSDTRVNKKWLDVIGKDYAMVNRLTRIYYNNEFFAYPLKPFDALSRLGLYKSTLCILSYLIAKVKNSKNNKTFESWVTNRFGYRLFSIFFKSYSEKLWGISCKRLDADFAAQRIKKLSLYEAIKSAFIKSGNKHKTLVDEFAYPLKGAGQIYSRMEDQIRSKKGKVFLSTRVKSVDKKNDKVYQITLDNKKTIKYDHVISTMPMTHLVEKIGAPKKVLNAAKKLIFRNTILVYLKVDSSKLFPDQWLYIHSDEVLTGRVTNFKNWVKTINNNQKETILCLEYWCYDDDDIWHQSENQMVKLAIKEIEIIGLAKSNKVIAGKLIRVPKCYPVYSTGYQKNLKIVENYLDGIKNLSVIGRYGAFKYNNQDHSILMGLLAAENIYLGKKKNNLWEINTDYEYQENSTITATGLQKN
tara:strand:+ start:285 stop:1715 length:1431 start_codon:yes stop_codon:yes gene_type:complete